MKTYLLVFILLFLATANVVGQECFGGEVQTHESYLYGRFEVTMQSAAGDGIVSSFFLYNKEAGCNWPAENNEIDVEMTGNSDAIHFTTHHPGNPDPWFYGENFQLGFSPHEDMHKYAIEWEPGIVRWFVDDELIYTQQDEATNNLVYPMAVFMNTWASGSEDWVGVWDPMILPAEVVYESVKYYRYSPGEGNYGSGNNFILDWEDEFESFDAEKWQVSDFLEFPLNFCTYRTTNFQVSDGQLILKITEPLDEIETIPTTFSVETAELNLESGDKIYLNGSFNNWCGTCNPMTKNSNIWELTLDLTPGRYEYLFTLNNWEATGGAPINSSCDFLPCDEFSNYGVLISAGQAERNLGIYCWNTCNTCELISSIESDKVKINRKLIKVVDLNGNQSDEVTNTILFYLFDDGSIEKRIILN